MKHMVSILYFSNRLVLGVLMKSVY